MLLDSLSRIPSFGGARCRVPEDTSSVTRIGDECAPESVGATSASIDSIWDRVVALYRTGAHPAIQVCVRREGRVMLDRAIGHARGNGPDDPPGTPLRRLELDTPINIFSASKSVTAMLVHKLDEQGALRLDDRVCEYIPGFERHGKQGVTLRHVLAHRAGIPNLPPDALDLDLLNDPDRIVELLCASKLQSRPGRALAYHAVTGGFILGEVMRRVTGEDPRSLLRTLIAEPIGLSLTNYGVEPERVDEVALNAFTGPQVPPPLSFLLKRALGASLPEITALSNDPRFLLAPIPSANVVSTAREMSLFYQCMLDEGRSGDVQVFEPRTIRHAVAEQSWWELDLTLMAPLRYGLGFMLGNSRVGPFGTDNPHAFGHIGFTNVFTWADPERALSVGLLTTGKPVVSPHVLPLFGFFGELGRCFDRLQAR